MGSSPTVTTEDRDTTTDEPETLHKTYESRRDEEKEKEVLFMFTLNFHN